MELFAGCSENCSNTRCNECLKFFEPLDEITGKCTTEKSYPAPKYDLAGFGNFERKGNSKKVYFTLYLKIVKGMMYNAQVSFILVRNSSGRRFLQETITGTGIQSNVAKGSYSGNSTMKDYLAKFDCEVDDGKSGSSYYLSYLQLDKANGEEELNSPITNQKFSTQDISKCEDNEIEKKYNRTGTFYNFAKKTKRLLSNERRLLSSTQKCLLSGNDASFTILGEVDVIYEPINKIYSVPTTAGKNLNCTLTKIIDERDASLDCKMDDPVRNFTISDDGEANDGSSTLSFDTDTTETLLCQTFYSESGQSDSSSGGGLSGGAIVGIVIVCIVIVAAIGVVLYFLKSGKAAAMLNETSSNAKIGENSNYSIPNDNTTSKIKNSK